MRQLLASKAILLTNGFKAAGITDTLDIIVHLTNEIEDYTESESHDEYKELLHVNRSKGVTWPSKQLALLLRVFSIPTDMDNV